MSTAQREGGLYFVNGKAVDANGEPVKDAPKQAPDTDPSKQPGAATGAAADPFVRIADTIASAIAGRPVSSPAAPATDPAADEDGGEDDEGLPTLDEMPEYLATLNTVDEVQDLRKTDKRKGAVPLYEARIAELQAE